MKIFIASSSELDLERLVISEMSLFMNRILLDMGHEERIEPEKWEYLDSAMGVDHKQEEYNRALEIRRRLASENPAKYEPDMASTLCNWALLKRTMGNKEDARHLADMGLKIYRKCEERNPGVYGDNVEWVRSIADGEE